MVDTELGRLGVLVCYDLRFPELARYYFHSGVEVLVVPGQWPESRGQHWRTLLRARAIENEVFVVGCNRTGQEPSLRNGEPMPFWDFVRKVAARLGFPPIKYTVPKSLMWGIAAIKEGIDTLKGGTLSPVTQLHTLWGPARY